MVAQILLLLCLYHFSRPPTASSVTPVAVSPSIQEERKPKALIFISSALLPLYQSSKDTVTNNQGLCPETNTPIYLCAFHWRTAQNNYYLVLNQTFINCCDYSSKNSFKLSSSSEIYSSPVSKTQSKCPPLLEASYAFFPSFLAPLTTAKHLIQMNIPMAV